ncbi:hypothetical protein TNCV_3209051 [Trichonephila clavipes]|nr:hypothetical protein TNCV_3209051 [Trichonephila clavipes]
MNLVIFNRHSQVTKTTVEWALYSPNLRSTPTTESRESNRDICAILLDEVEMDQTREEPDEILDINLDIESKFEKSDEQETFESKERFLNVSLRTPSKMIGVFRKCSTRHTAPCHKDTSKKKFDMLFVDHLRTIKLQKLEQNETVFPENNILLILSFEHLADDCGIWLGSTPSLRENNLGVVRGVRTLFTFHEPHERTCDSTAI